MCNRWTASRDSRCLSFVAILLADGRHLKVGTPKADTRMSEPARVRILMGVVITICISRVDGQPFERKVQVLLSHSGPKDLSQLV